jgi:hypothetical protein
LGGCWGSGAQYLNRTDTITTSAGDAQEADAAIHVIDPWPRYVGDKRIPANGERMVGAVQRYRTPSQAAGAVGQAGQPPAPAASGSPAPPPAPSSGAATPPATLPF